jgi:hypothetical protein
MYSGLHKDIVSRNGRIFMSSYKGIRVSALFTALLLILNTLIFGMVMGEGSPQTTESEDNLFMSLTTTVAIDAGENFYLYFDPDNRELVTESPYDLPPECDLALEMVPEWMRFNLSYKFRQLSSDYRTTFANLIINSPDEKYIDEIGFVIAHSAVDNLQDDYFFPELITHNAQLIYENDQYLNYVEIVEKDDYTTVVYKDKDNNSMELEREIYYFYIVHPKLSDELATYVDPDYDFTKQPPFDRNYGVPPEEGGEFWREWLFYSNDSGHPLLKEKLEGAYTVWEAISATNSWISGSMSFTSNEERPIQPVRIYRKHIGRCGEYQDMRNAAARAALIPSTCTSNSAEDHMWNEFWDNRWIHWDGGVDNPRMYENGWGKKISSVWIFRGDSDIWSVSEKYTDVCYYTATVLDESGNPVDGALVDVATENFYNPDLLTTTTWGTTDYTGTVTIPLGDERNFWSSAESDSLGSDPANGVTEIITDSVAGMNYTYTFNLPFSAEELNVQEITNPGVIDPKFSMNVKYEVVANILETQNSFSNEEGDFYSQSGNIDFFIANSLNYNLYAGGLGFDAYNVDERASSGEHLFVLPNDDTYFTVLSNEFSQATCKIVKITIDIYSDIMVDISAPSGSEYPLGASILFTGSAWGPSGIESVEVDIADLGSWGSATNTAGSGEEPFASWDFYLDTTGLMPGEHTVMARATSGDNNSIATISIILNDETDPELDIESPVDLSQHILGETIVLNGTASDNVALVKLDLTFNSDSANSTDITSYLVNDFYSYQISTLDLGDGDHTITVTAYDPASNTVSVTRSITILETVEPVVLIESPSEGEILKIGDVIEITGIATDNREVVELTIKIGDNTPQDITSELNPDGTWSYLWDTQSELDGLHTIEVSCEDSSMNSNFDAIEIILDGTPPEGSIINPLENEKIRLGDTLTISGTAYDEQGLFLVHLVIDEDYVLDLLPYIKDGMWSIERDSDDLGEGDHTLKLIVADMTLHTANDTRNFRILETVSPIVRIEEPRNEFYAKRGDTVSVSGHASDNKEIHLLTLQIDGNTPIDITSSLEEDGSWSYEWMTAGLSTTVAHTITVFAFDTAENSHSDSIAVIVDGDVPDATIALLEDKEIFKAGHPIDLVGLVEDEWKITELVLQIDEGSKIGLTGRIKDGEWEYQVTNTGSLETGTHTFTLTASDSVGHERTVSLDFEIDAEDPELEISEWEKSVNMGESVTISGYAGDDVEVVEISIIVDDNDPISIIPSYSKGMWFYELDTQELSQGKHTILVIVTDCVDNQAQSDIRIRLIEETIEPEPLDEEPDENDKNMVGPFEFEMFLLLIVILIVCVLTIGAMAATRRKKK